MKTWLKWSGLTILILCIICGVFRFSAHKAMTKYPSFYVPLLDVPDQKLNDDNHKLQVKVVNFAHHLKNDPKWSLTISQDEFNGWLEKGINETYPGLLPSGVYYPRVVFEPDRIYIASEYCPEAFDSVVWSQVNVSVLQPGVIRVVVEKTRMGVLPISSSFLKSKLESNIRESLAAKEGVDLKSDTESPLLKLTLEQMIEQWNLPLEISQNEKGQFQMIYDSTKYDPDFDWKVDLSTVKGRRITIDHLEVRHGELFVSGTSKKGK